MHIVTKMGLVLLKWLTKGTKKHKTIDLFARSTNKQIYSNNNISIQKGDKQVNKQQQHCKNKCKQNTQTATITKTTCLHL